MKQMARKSPVRFATCEELNTAGLAHISPIEWDNVTLDEEYVINRNLIRRTVTP